MTDRQTDAEFASKTYQNFISLGYFCEVAQDLEKMGLRNTSSPFDWCITNFAKNIELIENRFDDFMNYDNLAQSVNEPNHYLDTKYNDYFFHDFNQYDPLPNQYEAVKAKYDRRIKRFLKNIEQPTLFVRYISNEKKTPDGQSAELTWIETNYEYVQRVLKSYNAENEVIFIGDMDTKSDKIKVYNVAIDEGDVVSRSPIYNNGELLPLMTSFHIDGQEANQRRFEAKQARKHSLKTRVHGKAMSAWQNLTRKVYRHTKTYQTPGK